MPHGWQVGVDVGGTFTDVIAQHRARGEVRAAKVPSRPDDRIAGLVAALRAVDLAWSDVDDLIHGTTIVTNAIIEGAHAKVALIATHGFSDTLAIGRQNRRHLYRLDLPPKLAPQVPAERRFEVTERLDHDGRVMTALEPASVEDAIRRIEKSRCGGGRGRAAARLRQPRARAGAGRAAAHALPLRGTLASGSIRRRGSTSGRRRRY